MQQEPSATRPLTDDRGEIASWLILMAALAVIAGLLSGIIGPIMVDLAEGIGGAEPAGVPTAAPAAPTTPLAPSGPIEGQGPDSLPDTAAADPADPIEIGFSTGPPVPPETDLGPPETELEPEPEPISPETQSALDRIIDKIDNGDDLDMSEGELDDVRNELNDLSVEEIEYIFQQLSDQQLERLFHNVHSSGFWSNDWNDKERNEFYGLLSELSHDTQQRLAEYTDYFEVYDSGLDPRDVVVTEQEFVAGYEDITNLNIDEFLALRAHMWDNPELIADSPFDWYADGCSIPGGAYPGALNGPCLLHDFAYTNAKLAAEQFDPMYNDLEGSDIAEAWKQHADRRLRDDIADLPWYDTGDSQVWSEIVYSGVAVDLDVVGLPSGRDAFVDTYRPHYGPGFDPNLGQWSDDENNASRMLILVDLATNGTH